MDKLLAYGLMVVIIAALALIYRRGVKPAEKSFARFAAAFCELYRVSVCEKVNENVRFIENEDGTISLLPPDEQHENVRKAFARGNTPRARQLLLEMEQAARECFDSIGTSDRYRKRFYVPLSEIYTIAYLYHTACVTPEKITKKDELTDVEAMLHNYKSLNAELEMRMS